MASGMVFSVIQTLLSALKFSPEIRELSSMLGYKSKLEDLEHTVSTIRAVLLDADSKHQELTEVGSNWVEKLKDAIYDADDFFDKLITKAQQFESKYGNKLEDKVRRFFSDDNQLIFRFNTSREITNLREKLNAIADDQSKFGQFSEKYKPVKRRVETSSYIYDQTIIGREEEKEEIVGLLLSDSNSCVRSQNNVSFVSIVGMGGLGKTALAQLVYNDKRIRDAFGECLYWICVSEDFGEKNILSKFPVIEPTNTLQGIQEKVLNKIGGKKYLLVLDDVWEENGNKWNDLKRILSTGGVGTRILVTTRSNKVAKAIDQDVVVRELKGLSDKNSWQLFKKIAFGPGDDHDSHLVEIGNDIVKKCANVPLSIKVTGSLLYNQDKNTWEDYRRRDLTNMSGHGEEDQIMSSLMFSYYNLTPELKSCFSFCSLFKKDYEIEKEMLISLWLAEGYLVPHKNNGKSLEDVGEEYFLILLQRCFFQDVRRDAYGEIHSCKMHDLMHDLALKVAGKESILLMASSINDDMEKKCRHLSITRDAPIDSLYNKIYPSRQTLRTLVIFDSYISMNVNWGTLISNYRRLRVYHLNCYHMLHDELGNLLHLRYLDVSYSSSLETLPRSITKLYNLQILNLSGCKNLMELPHDIGKLVNLRTLKIYGCDELTKLPEDIVKLINLKILDIYDCSRLKKLREDKYEHSLYYFDNSKCKIRYMPAGIDKLRNLHTLTYFVVGGDNSIKVQKEELADLKGLSNLRGDMRINVLGCSRNNKRDATKGAQILREAQLKGLEIFCEDGDDQCEYHETLLEGLYPNNNNLDTLAMVGYQGVKFPKWSGGTGTFLSGIVRMVLTQCTGLKHLSSLSKLINLKYLYLLKMGNLEYIERDAPSDMSEKFLPSLEILTLENILNLKGWWKDVTWKEKDGEGGSGCLVDANDKCLELIPSFCRLRDLKIHYCKSLKYFPPCPQLKKLKIEYCRKLEVESIMWKSLHSLSSLKLSSLPKLVNLPKDFQQLSTLQSLEIGVCENFEGFGESLTSLTSLQSLKLLDCPKLKSLPEAIRHLTSLTKLFICEPSSELRERCQNPDGEDWPKIRHIPKIIIF